MPKGPGTYGSKRGRPSKKQLKNSVAGKILKPGPGKPAKKLGDEHDDDWEEEETKEGYWTPGADDTTGYDAKSDDNADDDFKHGGWTKENKPKGVKKMKTKNEDKNWIQDAEKSIDRRGTEGKCTPITKPGCTGRAKALAKTFKKMAKRRKDESRVTAYKDLAYRIDEILPALAAGAARVGAVVARGAGAGAKALGKVGAQVAKKGAKVAKEKAIGMAKDKLAQRAQAGPEGVATGGDRAKKNAELSAQAASDEDLEETTMKNIYIRTLMEAEKKKELTPAQEDMKRAEGLKKIIADREKVRKEKMHQTDDWTVYSRMGRALLGEEDEPTKKEAKKAVKDVKRTPVEGETKKETIEFEQGLSKKTPKKKYFGGATRPEDVDTKAAIKSQSDSIKAAGQAAVKKSKEKRDAEDKAAEQQNAWTEYRRIGKLFMEWEAGPIAKRIASKSSAGEEGRMSDTKGKKISPDPVADRETKKTAANVDKKLSDLASPKDKEGNIVKGKEKKVKANLKVKDVIQGGMNRRRAAAKAGKPVEGSPTIPPETREQARADAAEDKRRRMAPGDK